MPKLSISFSPANIPANPPLFGMADAASINGTKLVAIGCRAAKILDVEVASSTVIPSKDFINPDICLPNTSPGF